MNSARRRASIPLIILISPGLLLSTLQVRSSEQKRKIAAPLSLANREAAYRANNLGVALLEQYRTKEAVDSFNRALQIKPDLSIARINLSIALYYLPDLTGAKTHAEKALAQNLKAPQPHYILGLVARAQNRFNDAIAEFRKVLEIDSADVGSNIHLGQLFVQQQKPSDAIAAFRRAIDAEPYNETAIYNLGLLLVRTGRKDEGQRLLQKFQQLKQSGAGTTIGTNYLEGGSYAEAVVSNGSEAELVDRRIPNVRFTDVTNSSLPPFRNVKVPPSQFLSQRSGAVALFDADGDNDLDLVAAAGEAQRLYRNNGGKFTDITDESGELAKDADGIATGVVAGDLDNDSRADLFVLRYGKSSLYRNEGNGRFSDITTAAKIPDYKYLSNSLALVDYDHDGDLDILIGGGVDPSEVLSLEKATGSLKDLHQYSRNFATPAVAAMLLRNNGDGTFADQTTATKLEAPADTIAIVATDFDNRRDVDLLTASKEGISLWRNLRDGTFRDVSSETGLRTEKLSPSSVAVGDVNKDGYADFFFGNSALAGYFAVSDGKGHFQLKRGPGPLKDPLSAANHNKASALMDYDNDGLLDLVTAGTTAVPNQPRTIQLRVWRNTGGNWVDVSTKSAANMKALMPDATEGPGRYLFVAGDVDNDGDTDLIFGTIAGGLRFARNDGGNGNHSIAVNLRGRVSNRSALQARVEIRAGSLWQKLETYSASPAPAPTGLVFGLGKRDRPDVVRVLWPAGIVQAETEFPPISTALSKRIKLDVTELDRKPSSCPYLYTWNGEKFEFITDFMGGGEMGYLEAPGHYNQPDSDEYVRIRGDQLKQKNGRYEMRITNELEEAIFMDRLDLLAVAHPANVEIYPNEGMTHPPKPFKLFATRNARRPLSATDEHGHDVLDRISELDRTWPDDFKRARIRGYAEEHTLTMQLPSKAKSNSGSDRLILLLTGWTDYAWSSDNLAASQARQAMKPPALQIKDQEGVWRTVIEDVGIPVGRPQTVTVDLTGKVPSRNREVRIVTSMRIYWDQVLVDTSAGDSAMQVTRLDPMRADLRWRGFSEELAADGREPFGYDYQRVSFNSPWKVMTGRYTREGDVLELLSQSDDMFVICRSGDEIAVSFDATALPVLADGWRRTFLLYADGYSKEMDINSASPDQIEPLPFHGMSRYPYKWPERYPMTEAHRRYIEKYNTRLVTLPVPSIEIAIADR